MGVSCIEDTSVYTHNLRMLFTGVQKSEEITGPIASFRCSKIVWGSCRWGLGQAGPGRILNWFFNVDIFMISLQFSVLMFYLKDIEWVERANEAAVMELLKTVADGYIITTRWIWDMRWLVVCSSIELASTFQSGTVISKLQRSGEASF